MAVDSGTDVLRHLALEKLRGRSGKFHHFHATLDFTLGIGEDFAMLGSDHGSELVDMLVENLQELVEDAGAAQRRGAGPTGSSRLGGCYGRAYLLCRSECDLS